MSNQKNFTESNMDNVQYTCSIGLMCLSTSGYYTQVEILTGNS